jgi:hypothetical protein
MRPLRQINFFAGLLLLIVGGSALAYSLRNMSAGFRRGGFDAAYNAPNGVIDGAMGLAFIVIGLAMLRHLLSSRLSRVLVILVAAMIVMLGIHAGYVG